MKKQYLKILIPLFCIIFLLLINPARPANAQTQAEKFHSYIKSGIEKTFNMEFPQANEYFQKAVELDPENPTGYAFLTTLYLFIYEMSFDENVRKSYLANTLRYVDETIFRGEKRLIKNPKDGKAYLAMALARSARLNWYTHSKRYLFMAHEASTIWKCLEKAKEYDPYNYDSYFLTGVFLYHMDNLHGFSRFFSSMLITSGDRQKGLQELELAAQKGDFLKELALSELAADYMTFEKQPARALPIARKLKETFFNNYNYSFALADNLSDLRRFDEAFNIANEIERNIRAGRSPYVPQLQPRYEQLMGRIYFTQGNYAKAEEHLQKALKDTTSYNARVRAWAYLQMGMMNDARGERAKAEDYYFKTLNVKSGEGAAQIYARKYLKKPYASPGKRLGRS
ncbi:MAG: tetratricopeptide repeat protein [Smithella sp.]